jgi:branched-chain amino acid transport system ATP-binding protein
VSGLLHLHAVSRRFGGLVALHDLSLDVAAGTRHAVIGPNGAGKTTLLNLIAGSLRPTSGRITFDGRDITRLPAPARARQGIGRTFQHPALFGRLTVTANLTLALNRTTRRGRAGQVARLLDDAGLTGYAHVPAGRLPYGLRRRLELAMVLAGRPRLLLLDEPSAGLDPDETARLSRLLTAQTGDEVTVLLVDHNLDLVWSLAHTVTALHHGRHLATADPDTIRADPHVQAAYLTTGDQQPVTAARPERSPTGPTLLRVRQLHAGYHGAPVLDGVNLDLQAGEAVAVLGRNGAGKTTLLNTIGGLHAAWPGSRIELAGHPLIARRPHDAARAGLAVVPQGRRLFGRLTVAEHLACAATAHRRGPAAPVGPPWTVDRVLALLPALADRVNQPAHRLSGGEQQMLALARALLTNPRLLILDEPSEGLAPAITTQLTRTLSELVADGLAVLVAEQNLALATAVADRLLVLDRGRIAMTCPTSQLNEPTHRHRLHQLLGVAASTTTAQHADVDPSQPGGQSIVDQKCLHTPVSPP